MPGDQATNGRASAAISSPQMACACRFGWNPSHANRSGSNAEIRSTTRRGNRCVRRSAAACSAAERQPRIWRRGHGRAGKQLRGATPPTTTAGSPTRVRTAVTNSARSSAKVAGERYAVASLTPKATSMRSASSGAMRGRSCLRASLTVAPESPSARHAIGRPVRRASARAVVAATNSSPLVSPTPHTVEFANSEQPDRFPRAGHQPVMGRSRRRQAGHAAARRGTLGDHQRQQHKRAEETGSNCRGQWCGTGECPLAIECRYADFRLFRRPLNDVAGGGEHGLPHRHNSGVIQRWSKHPGSASSKRPLEMCLSLQRITGVAPHAQQS